MNLSSATLPPLARAAIPAQSTRYSPELILWDELLPGGCHWSGVIRRGNTLRLTDRDGSVLLAAKRLVVDADALPLLLGRVSLAGLTLDAPQLLARRDAAGQSDRKSVV